MRILVGNEQKMKKESIVYGLPLCVLLFSAVFVSMMIRPPISSKTEETQLINKYNPSKMNEKENYTQTVHTALEEISGTNELSVSPLNSIKSAQSSILYDTVDYWLLNFTYNKIYQSQSHQEDTSGIIQYNLNQTVTTTVFASMPVVLATYRNNSMTANDRTQIITQAIVDDNYPARMGFSIDFDFDYFFKAQIFGIGPVIGPGIGSLPFDKNWSFDTPMNGQAVLGKVGVSFPTVIPLLNLGVSVGPKIDTDFSASVSSDDFGVSLSNNFLDWKKEGSIQAFSVEVPEFFFQDYVTTDLFDFDMEFILSLVFYLDITIGLPIFNLPFHFPIFSFPVLTNHLQPENSDVLTLATNVLPSDDLPFVYGVAYNYSDQNGDDDGILEPSDIVSFSVLTTNLGDGSALSINSTADSMNVSVSGEDSIPLLLKNQGNYELQTNFQFTIPSDYSGNFILVNVTFDYFSVNGSIWTSLYELYFRVVHSGDTYLEVSNVLSDIPDDYWKSGEELGLYFNVTNRGSADILNAQILVAGALDTDTVNTAILVSDQTNISNVNIGSSEVLGFVNLSTMSIHDDGLVYLYFYVYYEDATYAYVDLLYFAIPVFAPKPSFNLLSAAGYDSDLDGLFEAGETVELEFSIQNTGEGEAYTVSGFVTSDNPDLNITNPHIVIGDLAVLGSGTSTRARIHIPVTARNQTAVFTLHIVCTDSNGHDVYQTVNITMDIVELLPPEITILSYSIDDFLYGNGDGIPDPGEVFFLHINVQVDNTGFSITGSANTTSQLIFYNASSFYGDLGDQISSGDGFIVEVPLNYPGGTSRIDVTLFAESYSGRKVSASGYLELTIDTGDITAPTMSLLDTIPSQILQNDDLAFVVDIEDPSIANEITTGIYKVLLLWVFNEGDIQITEVLDQDSDGIYDFSLDTSSLGTYYFIPVTIDNAGNIQYIAINDQAFAVEVFSATTTSTTTSTTSKTTISTTTSFETPLHRFFILSGLISTIIIWRIRRGYSRKRSIV
ncbi:hypothetical protein CEE45_01635 [Candidatus Heimdallarchaeota archaeon B3_Heim]|nr:MAG: hypothetical protein CEE45_01635 [Candidatus Heimdallarchaeota archaeon B3_Heim]